MTDEPSSSQFSRRLFLLAPAAALFAAQPAAAESVSRRLLPGTFDPYETYAGFTDYGFPIKALNPRRMNPKLFRRMVRYQTRHAPGTILVNTRERATYLVLDDGLAVRYAVAVGKAGLAFKGQAVIGNKAEWPRWIPTKEMVERDPKKYARYADGVDGGLTNPIGPRALYLHVNGRDTYYRLHGTTEPGSIGRSVSNGCIRLFNQDIIDLYDRVDIGAKVIVS
jgi:lipoprotein-anchoring transpeptidase ErfK/SrfK